MVKNPEWRESRLLNEWLKEAHPQSLQWKRVRVGPPLTGHENPVYSVLNRWADAVIFEGGEVFIIEAKLKAAPGAIGQLKLYGKLFPGTPEFSELKDKPLRLVLLAGITDQAVKALCKDEGIEYIVYTPPWVKDWLKAVTESD